MGLGLVLQGHAFAKADPDKVIRIAFEQADNGFDMQRVSSLYSTWMSEAIYETLMIYDYLARPAKLVPQVAEDMPEITNDGRTYTFRIRKGIFFTPDPAFKDQKRELTSTDVAYTLKRIMDPKTLSPQAGSFEGKFVGMEELVKEAKASGKFDYDKPIAGLETPDKYTLRLNLAEPDSTMLHLLANSHSGIVAREVVEANNNDVGRHPVGTGAYMLKEYVPGSRVILVANPDYRGFTWDFKASEPGDERLVKEMKGKQMPQVGRIEVLFIEEDQSRWLAFDSGQIDLAELADHASTKVLDNGKLRPAFVEKGIKISRSLAPAITYTFFNFRDPQVGGFSLEKIALRRALAMSYRVKDEIVQVRYGQAVRAQSIIPPGVYGYDPAYRNSIPYDPDLANKLLDRFGYKKGPDGFRNHPDGKPLVLRIHSAPSTRDKAIMEIWKRSLDAIGVRAEFPVSSFADNLKAAYRCELMMWQLGGVAGIPDGMDFLDSYYGPNAGRGANRNCYQSEAYDEMFRKARILPEGPERLALYQKMVRQLEADTAITLNLWRYRNFLSQGRVLGYKKHPIMYGDWRFLDVEKK
ncbi:ABC transporter substrate-binding protein [Noviherbaspirillum galbum]|uniref:Heme-binding protein n=1 Tax=Noviherbaspirillum galbum TaxID=2709383 RepID=A0A6B3SVP6_9BURK|nr:ABC transporter substrate-binding protein [Noviherbaspirillum galbum]NEX61699.1 heme-binding protein [Noviherbaspirillum galbum]